MNQQDVILVDADDRPLGAMEKMAAHREGRLHRAFSVFVFNGRGELMLQRRALDKYHSGGLWTNTCCSHPYVGEDTLAGAHRRLREEMGFDCPLQHAFSFEYRAELGELVEHELDHVYVGHFDAPAEPDPAEVAEWRFFSLAQIGDLMQHNPGMFTAWFRICWPRMAEMQRLAASLPPDS